MDDDDDLYSSNNSKPSPDTPVSAMSIPLHDQDNQDSDDDDLDIVLNNPAPQPPHPSQSAQSRHRTLVLNQPVAPSPAPAPLLKPTTTTTTPTTTTLTSAPRPSPLTTASSSSTTTHTNTNTNTTNPPLLTPAQGAASAPSSSTPYTSDLPVPAIRSTVDLDAVGTYEGKSILEVEIDGLEDKAWRRPGTDLTDYFNYGFTEDTWRAYIVKQKELRSPAVVKGLTHPSLEAMMAATMMPGMPMPGMAGMNGMGGIGGMGGMQGFMGAFGPDGTPADADMMSGNPMAAAAMGMPQGGGDWAGMQGMGMPGMPGFGMGGGFGGPGMWPGGDMGGQEFWGGPGGPGGQGGAGGGGGGGGAGPGGGGGGDGPGAGGPGGPTNVPGTPNRGGGGGGGQGGGGGGGPGGAGGAGGAAVKDEPGGDYGGTNGDVKPVVGGGGGGMNGQGGGPGPLVLGSGGPGGGGGGFDEPHMGGGPGPGMGMGPGPGGGFIPRGRGMVRGPRGMMGGPGFPPRGRGAWRGRGGMGMDGGWGHDGGPGPNDWEGGGGGYRDFDGPPGPPGPGGFRGGFDPGWRGRGGRGGPPFNPVDRERMVGGNFGPGPGGPGFGPGGPPFGRFPPRGGGPPGPDRGGHMDGGGRGGAPPGSGSRGGMTGPMGTSSSKGRGDSRGPGGDSQSEGSENGRDRSRSRSDRSRSRSRDRKRDKARDHRSSREKKSSGSGRRRRSPTESDVDSRTDEERASGAGGGDGDKSRKRSRSRSRSRTGKRVSDIWELEDRRRQVVVLGCGLWSHTESRKSGNLIKRLQIINYTPKIQKMQRNRATPSLALDSFLTRVLLSSDLETHARSSAESDSASLQTLSLELIAKHQTLARIRDEVAREVFGSSGFGGGLQRSSLGPITGSDDFTARLATRLHSWTVRLSSLVAAKSESGRYMGAMLVRETMEQCPELFPGNFSGWTTGLMAQLRRTDSSSHTLFAAVDTLWQLFANSSDFPDLYRDVTSVHVPKFVEVLLSLGGKNGYDAEVLSVVLRQLFTVTTTFPSLVKTNVNNVEKLCLQFLSGNYDGSSPLVCLAADILGALSLVGAKSAVAETWHTRLNKVLGSANAELDLLFRSVEEEKRPPQNSQLLDLPSLPRGDFFSTFPTRLNRLSALSHCVARFLGANYIKVPVQVPTETLLGLCERIAGVYEGIDLKHPPDAEEASILMTTLPLLYGCAARILMCTMLSTKDILLPFIRSVSGIVRRLMASTGSDQIRLIAYTVLETAIDLYGAGFLIVGERWREFISFALDDIAALTTDFARASVNPVGEANSNESGKSGSWKKQKKHAQGHLQLSTGGVEVMTKGPKVAVAVAASKALSATIRHLRAHMLPSSLPNVVMRQILHFSAQLPDELRICQYSGLLDLVLAEPSVKGFTSVASGAFAIAAMTDPREDVRPQLTCNLVYILTYESNRV
ncbi:pre-mRNA 3-end-processing factor fip1l1 [Gonapodya sp. JEL0774]|nr:pre-mRNA 3-end-processing factor fip1l1 [Gonapodya sp. JEL0774]